ncbi:MAG: DUF1540 domain-containing protein [Sedimentisphaerales bacterium]|nr:DUF1540 domain-containing protein [Sedimentisphaerales bacterium]
MKMTKVKECEARECAYNSGNQCHTIAITIGDGTTHPMCDTFCSSNMKGGDFKICAGVGACKVSECIFNVALECQSPDIRIGRVGNELDCMTFQMR